MDYWTQLTLRVATAVIAHVYSIEKFQISISRRIRVNFENEKSTQTVS